MTINDANDYFEPSPTASTNSETPSSSSNSSSTSNNVLPSSSYASSLSNIEMDENGSSNIGGGSGGVGGGGSGSSVESESVNMAVSTEELDHLLNSGTSIGAALHESEHGVGVPNFTSPPSLEAQVGDDLDGSSTPFWEWNNEELIRESESQIERDISERCPLVSSLIPIEQLHTEYQADDTIYQEKVNDLKVKYESLRKVRPDGNCFYRAFIFNFFESLLHDAQAQVRMNDWLGKTRQGILEALGVKEEILDEFYENFESVFKWIQQGMITNSTQLLEALDEPGMSDQCVVYLRLLTSYFLQTHSDFFEHFIEGYQSISDFCHKEVEPMYKDGDHVQITALTSVFAVTVRIVYMDRGGSEDKVNELDFNPIGDSDSQQQQQQQQSNAEDIAKPRVHLLYRPGHYDVLYLRQSSSEPPAHVCTSSSLSPNPSSVSNAVDTASSAATTGGGGSVELEVSSTSTPPVSPFGNNHHPQHHQPPTLSSSSSSSSNGQVDDVSTSNNNDLPKPNSP